MKKSLKILSLLILVIIVQSCKTDGCENVLCPPDSAFRFEVVDKTNGENLFTNGTFQPNDLEITDIEDESNVEFTFNENDIISIHTIGPETVNYSIQISAMNIFELSVDAERISGDCCDYINFKTIEITNAEFQIDQDSGVYRIRIE